MKKLLYLLIMISVGVCSCSDDDDKPATPSFLKTGKATVPANWVAPDYSLYELTMSVQVQLGDTGAAWRHPERLPKQWRHDVCHHQRRGTCRHQANGQRHHHLLSSVNRRQRRRHDSKSPLLL